MTEQWENEVNKAEEFERTTGMVLEDIPIEYDSDLEIIEEVGVDYSEPVSEPAPRRYDISYGLEHIPGLMNDGGDGRIQQAEAIVWTMRKFKDRETSRMNDLLFKPSADKILEIISETETIAGNIINNENAEISGVDVDERTRELGELMREEQDVLKEINQGRNRGDIERKFGALAAMQSNLLKGLTEDVTKEIEINNEIRQAYEGIKVDTKKVEVLEKGLEKKKNYFPVGEMNLSTPGDSKLAASLVLGKLKDEISEIRNEEEKNAVAEAMDRPNTSVSKEKKGGTYLEGNVTKNPLPPPVPSVEKRPAKKRKRDASEPEELPGKKVKKRANLASIKEDDEESVSSALQFQRREMAKATKAVEAYENQEKLNVAREEAKNKPQGKKGAKSTINDLMVKALIKIRPEGNDRIYVEGPGGAMNSADRMLQLFRGPQGAFDLSEVELTTRKEIIENIQDSDLREAVIYFGPEEEKKERDLMKKDFEDKGWKYWSSNAFRDTYHGSLRPPSAGSVGNKAGAQKLFMLVTRDENKEEKPASGQELVFEEEKEEEESQEEEKKVDEEEEVKIDVNMTRGVLKAKDLLVNLENHLDSLAEDNPQYENVKNLKIEIELNRERLAEIERKLGMMGLGEHQLLEKYSIRDSTMRRYAKDVSKKSEKVHKFMDNMAKIFESMEEPEENEVNEILESAEQYKEVAESIRTITDKDDEESDQVLSVVEEEQAELSEKLSERLSRISGGRMRMASNRSSERLRSEGSAKRIKGIAKTVGKTLGGAKFGRFQALSGKSSKESDSNKIRIRTSSSLSGADLSELEEELALEESNHDEFSEREGELLLDWNETISKIKNNIKSKESMSERGSKLIGIGRAFERDKEGYITKLREEAIQEEDEIEEELEKQIEISEKIESEKRSLRKEMDEAEQRQVEERLLVEKEIKDAEDQRLALSQLQAEERGRNEGTRSQIQELEEVKVNLFEELKEGEDSIATELRESNVQYTELQQRQDESFSTIERYTSRIPPKLFVNPPTKPFVPDERVWSFPPRISSEPNEESKLKQRSRALSPKSEHSFLSAISLSNQARQVFDFDQSIPGAIGQALRLEESETESAAPPSEEQQEQQRPQQQQPSSQPLQFERMFGPGGAADPGDGGGDSSDDDDNNNGRNNGNNPIGGGRHEDEEDENRVREEEEKRQQEPQVVIPPARGRSAQPRKKKEQKVELKVVGQREKSWGRKTGEFLRWGTTKIVGGGYNYVWDTVAGLLTGSPEQADLVVQSMKSVGKSRSKSKKTVENVEPDDSIEYFSVKSHPKEVIDENDPQLVYKNNKLNFDKEKFEYAKEKNEDKKREAALKVTGGLDLSAISDKGAENLRKDKKLILDEKRYDLDVSKERERRAEEEIREADNENKVIERRNELKDARNFKVKLINAEYGIKEEVLKRDASWRREDMDIAKDRFDQEMHFKQEKLYKSEIDEDKEFRRKAELDRMVNFKQVEQRYADLTSALLPKIVTEEPGGILGRFQEEEEKIQPGRNKELVGLWEHQTHQYDASQDPSLFKEIGIAENPAGLGKMTENQLDYDLTRIDKFEKEFEKEEEEQQKEVIQGIGNSRALEHVWKSAGLGELDVLCYPETQYMDVLEEFREYATRTVGSILERMDKLEDVNSYSMVELVGLEQCTEMMILEAHQGQGIFKDDKKRRDTVYRFAEEMEETLVTVIEETQEYENNFRENRKLEVARLENLYGGEKTRAAMDENFKDKLGEESAKVMGVVQKEITSTLKKMGLSGRGALDYGDDENEQSYQHKEKYMNGMAENRYLNQRVNDVFGPPQRKDNEFGMRQGDEEGKEEMEGNVAQENIENKYKNIVGNGVSVSGTYGPAVSVGRNLEKFGEQDKKITEEDINLLKLIVIDKTTGLAMKLDANGELVELTDAEKSRVAVLIIEICLFIYTRIAKVVSEEKIEELRKQIKETYDDENEEDILQLVKIANTIANKVREKKINKKSLREYMNTLAGVDLREDSEEEGENAKMKDEE